MENLFRAVATFCLGAIAYATTFLVVTLADLGKIVNERYPEEREPAQW